MVVALRRRQTLSGKGITGFPGLRRGFIANKSFGDDNLE